MECVDLPTIPEFYRGRTILVTGGSGFMGKVLVEKLLRSCPHLDTVYLLLREKKNRDAANRVRDVTDQPLFDRIRCENPDLLGKLVAVSGDVMQPGLGLSPADRRMLQAEVSAIFHSAASVRFDDPIRDAVLINVRGTRELVNLALGMNKLQVFLHVSTAFSNCTRLHTEEVIYEAPGDWRVLCELVERVDDDHLMRCITPKILAGYPNTYTYTKALAEHIVNDHRDRLPVVIVRPSIVTSTMREPFAGWVDNFNGPLGLMLAGGKGLVRTTYASPTVTLDCVPVDQVIKSMIYLAWYTALFQSTTGAPPSAVPVYNCANLSKLITLPELIRVAMRHVHSYQFNYFLLYPNPTITHNRLVYYLKVLLYHMVPAVIGDAVLQLKGKTKMLVKLQRKIYIAIINLKYFNGTNLTFSNDRLLAAHKSMLLDDRAEFSFDEHNDNFHHLVKCNYIGARYHLLKEPPSPMDRVIFDRLYWVDRVSKTAFSLLLIWMFGLCQTFATGFAWLTDQLHAATNIITWFS